MDDVSDLKQQLIDEGNMTAERAEDAMAFLIEHNLPLRFMVTMIIAKRTGPKLDVRHIKPPKS